MGKYQYMLSGVVACVWYSTGSLLLSVAFFFLNPEFDCEAFGLVTKDCTSFVCSLPEQEWPKFVTD